MKKLSRNEMKKVMGGDAPLDKPCGKCCTNGSTTDCTTCKTGISCNANGTFYSCPQNGDGTCAA